MIAVEINNKAATVRIHDEFCSTPSQGCISRLNQIVTDSYKRRSMNCSVETDKSEVQKPQ